MMFELILVILGAVIGAVLTAIFSTKNFKEMVNFQIGKIRCRLNNQRHHYKYFAEMYDSDTGKSMPVNRCEICGDLTPGSRDYIYDKIHDRVVRKKKDTC